MEQAWEPSSSQERMVAASSKRFILTKEMNHFYEQLMVVVSRSGFDFTPGSATRLWLWGGSSGSSALVQSAPMAAAQPSSDYLSCTGVNHLSSPHDNVSH